MNGSESQKACPKPSTATWAQSRVTRVRGVDWGPRGPRSPARGWGSSLCSAAGSRSAPASSTSLPGAGARGDAHRRTAHLGPYLVAALAGLDVHDLPHAGFKRLEARRRRTAGCGGSVASAAPSYKRLPRPRWLMSALRANVGTPQNAAGSAASAPRIKIRPHNAEPIWPRLWRRGHGRAIRSGDNRTQAP